MQPTAAEPAGLCCPPVPSTVTERAAVALYVASPKDPSLGGELKQSWESVSKKDPQCPQLPLGIRANPCWGGNSLCIYGNIKENPRRQKRCLCGSSANNSCPSPTWDHFQCWEFLFLAPQSRCSFRDGCTMLVPSENKERRLPGAFVN